MGFGLGSLGSLLGATLDSVKVSVGGHDGLVGAHLGAAKGVVGGLLGAHAGDVGLSVGGHDGLIALKIGGLDAHSGADHHNWHC
jgi:hypothetical protein